MDRSVPLVYHIKRDPPASLQVLDGTATPPPGDPQINEMTLEETAVYTESDRLPQGLLCTAYTAPLW